MIDLSQINCTGCHSCYSVCPQNCIEMKPDNEGFLYPYINDDNCIDCGLCEKSCPSLNPVSVSIDSNLFACYRKNLVKRMESASGGIFSVLAELIISEGGVVFGAAFDEQWNLKHIAVDNTDDLIQLKGSKYVQSEIGNSFVKVKELLEQGRKVLFSGTSCQIQGLKSFLKKDYNNLLCVDLICHGVPSPKVWQKYIEEISNGRNLFKLNQRDKSKGINNAPIIFEFEDGKKFKQKYNDNLYIRGFIQNLYLRPSCYKCDFKGIERSSDITIGDFWGLENYKPDFVDKYGVSAVIIHTQKGLELFERIEDKLSIVDCNNNYEWVTSQNPCVDKSVIVNSNRRAFFNRLDNVSFDKLIKDYTMAPSKKKYYYRIKEIILKPFWIMKKGLSRII